MAFYSPLCLSKKKNHEKAHIIENENEEKNFDIWKLPTHAS